MNEFAFPFKIGDQVRVAKLTSWSTIMEPKSPICCVHQNDIITITAIGKLSSCGSYMPFAGTVNGTEYGFTYGKQNIYELIKNKDTMDFPFKVGDQIKVIGLNKWASGACNKYPFYDVHDGDIITITKIKDYIPGNDYISFAGTVNGVEYGFCYSEENEYELYKELNMEEITRKDYLRIYDIACDLWREKLEKMYNEIFNSPFAEEGLISEDRIHEMLDACSPTQKPLLEGIFKDYIGKKEDKNPIKTGAIKDDTISRLSAQMFGNGSFLGVLGALTPENRPELNGRALWLSDSYEVKVFPANISGTVIEFIKK